MSLTFLTYLVVGFTFALYIGIAIAARASSTKDFYVADGGVHPVAARRVPLDAAATHLGT